MENFTPFLSLIGGLLIGIASLVLMLGMGRIMGASGIISGIIDVKNIRIKDISWRISFVIGMIIGALLYAKFTQMNLGESIHIKASYITLIIAGLFVGCGTVLAKGCTSGHGVSGLGRLSKRSMVAVIVFMVVAVITASIIHNFIL